jgi:MFS family permease
MSWRAPCADSDVTAPPAAAAAPATYGRLLRVPGLRALLVSSLLTRTASQMWLVGIVLFALQRYHSPSVAGVSIFLLIFPGLTLSPIAGALLDRHGRKRLMGLDFSVAATCLTVIVVLAATNHLPIWGLLLLLVAGSVTSTLSIAGARSMFPLLVPRDLWDRGNAADSICFGTSAILGPGLAGWLIASLGSEAALAGAAVGYLAGVVALRWVREPAVSGEVSGRIFHEAWRGLRYVAANRTLRWIAVSMSTLNVGWGMVVVALPVLVFRQHGNAAAVGTILAIQGAVGIPAALVFGRLRTDGRERQMMAILGAIMGIATLALLAPSILFIGVGIAIIGAADGPFNICTFSLRQRRTAQAWFGRAFAISMSLNFAGVPVGSAISGPLLGVSISFAIVLAAALMIGGGILMVLKIPATDDGVEAPEPLSRETASLVG